MKLPNKDSSKYKTGIVNIYFWWNFQDLSILFYYERITLSFEFFTITTRIQKEQRNLVFLSNSHAWQFCYWPTELNKLNMTLWSKSNWISWTISAGIVYEFLLLNSSESEHFQRGFLPGISRLKDFLLLCKLNHLQSLSFQIFGKLTMNW